jgi:hypothetical protein
MVALQPLVTSAKKSATGGKGDNTTSLITVALFATVILLIVCDWYPGAETVIEYVPAKIGRW